MDDASRHDETGDMTFERASGETVENTALQGAALQACYDTITCTNNQTVGTLRERRLVQRRRVCCDFGSGRGGCERGVLSRAIAVRFWSY